MRALFKETTLKGSSKSLIERWHRLHSTSFSLLINIGGVTLSDASILWTFSPQPVDVPFGKHQHPDRFGHVCRNMQFCGPLCFNHLPYVTLSPWCALKKMTIGRLDWLFFFFFFWMWHMRFATFDLAAGNPEGLGVYPGTEAHRQAVG